MCSKVEVVISGIGGLFPSCLDLNEFQDLLLKNVNTIQIAKWIESVHDEGKSFYNNMPLKRELSFDATFFGLHGTQVRYLDTLTRLMLEQTYEAVIDSGVNPADIHGENIAVIINSTVSETDSHLCAPVKSGFGITGQARSMISNRISYWLHATGPSYSIDSNWNGGIEGIQMALSMIESGTCVGAIVGAVNCAATPCVQWLSNQRGLLSKDGLTRAFDEQGDGYSRGDGAVALFLQRADLAKRNYATVLYANTIFKGIREGDFVGCDPDMFHDFLQQCYADSNIDPKHIAYLETYGCGLKNIDEAELAAVERVFCKDRDTPLQIGSVKTNIGHAEPVSSLMSLIKIIVAMETGIIPAHLNYNQPNKNIPALTNGKIEVVTKNKEWTGELAAINCIGIGTSYGHMIVRRNNQPKVDIKTDLPLLLTYSTRTEEGIEKITKNVQLQSSYCYNYLVHEVFSSNIPGNLYRGYSMKASTDKMRFQHYSGNKSSVWFVYSGMGSQWQTMGRDLMKLPIFAEAIYKCHNILKPKGIDLLHIITDDDPQIFENILNSFVGIAAVQIALTDVLHAIGIQPDGIIGHSVGELGCAYADKCLTAEQMILSAYYRGKASLDADLPVGMMAAIGLGYSDLKPICPLSIDIACHNSANSCTISGPANDVAKFVNILSSKGVFARLVNVSNIAYHSRYIKPAAPLLLSYLKDLIPEPKPRSSKWMSTSVPQSKWNTDLARTVSPEYLTNNLLSSVLFAETLPFIPDNAIAIEIAPHGLLQTILKRALSSDVTNMALTRKDTNCLEFLFNSLGQLYINGLDFNLNPLYPPVSLPVPAGTKSLCNFVQWEHGDEWQITTYEAVFIPTERTFNIDLNAIEFEQFSHYKIDNTFFVPPALYFGYINEMINKDGKIKNITFEDVVFKEQIKISALGNASITIMIESGTGHFEVYSEGIICVTGIVIKNKNENLPPVQIESNENIANITGNNFYKELNVRGYMFQKEYTLVSALNIIENGFKAIATYTKDWTALITALLQTHLFYTGEASTNILLPKYIQRVNISFDHFENNKKESVAWFNSKTSILESNNGIHITGIQYEPLKIVNNTIKIENLKFMKHFDDNIQDIENGLDMFMKIVIENVGSKNLVITELKEKYDPKYLPYIDKYLSQNQLKAKTIEISKIDNTLLEDSSLSIVSGKFFDAISHMICNKNNFFLIYFSKSHSMYKSNRYSTIAQFCTHNQRLCLLKKANITPVKVINIINNSSPWSNDLKAMSRDGNSRIYLVFRTIPVEGIQEFVAHKQHLLHNGQNLRFMFILDSSAVECRPEEKFYAQVFEKDLVVNVLKHGTWGNFGYVSETSKMKTYNSIMRAVNSNDFLSGCLVNYVGLHTADLTRIDDANIPCEVGALDFAGTRCAGDRVMGFAQTDLEHCKLDTEPSFVWPVPRDWTQCDAATVPYAYTLAYYMLFIVGDISKSDMVLVHAGSSEVGQAVLNVAYNYGCIVFTTVANQQQKLILKKLMPEINDCNILNSETTQFELAILDQTAGRGVDVVLNCLPGQRLQVSKHVLANHSRFIQLGSADLHQYATTGMKEFIRNISFYGITGQHLLRLDKKIKDQLHEMVSQGIQARVVVPIRRRIFLENRVDDSLRYLRSSAAMGAAVMQINHVNYEKPDLITKSPVPHLHNQDSYLIYADSRDTWVTLVQCLVNRGAKRIIIANKSNQNQFVNRFLSIIKHNYNVELIEANNTADTLENTKSLVNEIRLIIGYVKEIFIFATNSDELNYKIFENIDAAFSQVQQNGRMVCILGTNKEKSYIRANGLPVCNITWDNTCNVQDISKNFDAILTTEDKTNVMMKNDIIKSKKSTEEAEIAEVSSMFLPNSLKTIILLGQNELQAANIVQLGSFVPKKICELPPVFLVPGLAGLHCPDLRQFIRQLMYPVFCINLPAMTFQDDIVAHLAQQILQVRQCKVYKLIGVSWGGILAIEIAKHLESLGKKIELHLIDSDPQVIQNFTNIFSKTGAFNMTLLKQLIKVDGMDVENLLLSADLSQYDYKVIVNSLTVLKNLIEYANFYKPLPNKINGPTTVILSSNTVKSISLKEQCMNIQDKVLKGNHCTILHNKSVIEFLNDNLD